MNEIDKIIENSFSKLPAELQTYLQRDSMLPNIKSVVVDQPLQPTQINVFGIEVMLVLLQLETVEGFAMNIKRNMEISMSRAEDIATKTKQLIFAPVQDFLIVRAQQELSAEERRGGSGILPPNNTSRTPQQSINNLPEPILGSEQEIRPPQTTPHAQEETQSTISKLAHTSEENVSDMFKKKLEVPVHTQAEKETIERDNSPQNLNPSSDAALARDPYKETID